MLSHSFTILTEKSIDKSTIMFFVIILTSHYKIAKLRLRLKCTIVLEMTANRLEMIAMQS